MGVVTAAREMATGGAINPTTGVGNSPITNGANRQVRVWDGVNPVDQTMVAGREESSVGMLVMVVVTATSNAGNGRFSP
jgi:hypothetical protein